MPARLRRPPGESVRETVEQWMKQVEAGPAGYVTPKVAIGAVVGNDEGELLLLQRSDSGIWLYPTGWADIGYSASEVAVKEVREETGIDIEVVRLLAVFDGFRFGFTRIPLYSLIFLCRAVGGELGAIRWKRSTSDGSPVTHCRIRSRESITGVITSSRRCGAKRSR